MLRATNCSVLGVHRCWPTRRLGRYRDKRRNVLRGLYGAAEEHRHALRHVCVNTPLGRRPGAPPDAMTGPSPGAAPGLHPPDQVLGHSIGEGPGHGIGRGAGTPAQGCVDADVGVEHVKYMPQRPYSPRSTFPAVCLRSRPQTPRRPTPVNAEHRATVRRAGRSPALPRRRPALAQPAAPR